MATYIYYTNVTVLFAVNFSEVGIDRLSKRNRTYVVNEHTSYEIVYKL